VLPVPPRGRGAPRRRLPGGRPDYPGFGRSDKPVDPAFYTYDRHVTAMGALVEHLGLEGAAAVVQDWGGPIGLRLAVDLPGRFGRLAVLNTSLFTGPPPRGSCAGGPSPPARTTCRWAW